jgi:glycosyltransferase A (GT-A) superfamily protein (DUF2064 family)
VTAVAVIAKECLPGRVKTRLQPEFSAAEAAALAAASLADTLRVAGALPASRRILYFDGAVPPADARGWEVISQCGGNLDDRIGALFDAVDEPLLLLGMDTPHLDPDMLSAVFAADQEVDAWFGPATDGGFWALGMRRPDGDLVRGVPMSLDTTGFHQLQRLTAAGLRVRLLPPLTDIDTPADVPEAARRAPALARALRTLRPAGVTA